MLFINNFARDIYEMSIEILSKIYGINNTIG